jgi:threonine aldolase
MSFIDLRSDTVTKPSKEMRLFMMNAEVGDDVYGEDPTVNLLEKMVAEMSGKESAIFTPTATQSNLLAIMSHCERGDECIVGATSHIYWWEGGGASVLGGVQYQTLSFEPDATLDFKNIEKVIKPIDPHHARTKLLCLENTHNGKIVPLPYLNEVKAFCTKHHLSSHLDGARVFNVVIGSKVTLQEVVKSFDTLTICFSKGLGAPAGAILCGSKDIIDKARRWRKVLGGGMRQAGILAASALFALEHNISRLQDDHENARLLADGLSSVDEIEVDFTSLHTNMFWFTPLKSYQDLREHLKAKGIILPSQPNKDGQIRIVTHLDVSQSDIYHVIAVIKAFYKKAN